jgi:hypothetical protein
VVVEAVCDVGFGAGDDVGVLAQGGGVAVAEEGLA